jgi:AcrR family transcriptional regulator
MSYIAERRSEEKERRRNEILDAAEALYSKQGWDSVTMDQVARGARLSRALLYVYFKDKQELLFAVGERAMTVLRDRFRAASASYAKGIDKIEAIGRAYMGYAFEFPHYFDFCSRYHAHSSSGDSDNTDEGCRQAGDQAIGAVVEAIQAGLTDGTVRKDVGDPMMLAVSLWAFSHGLIQLAMAKANDLARMNIGIADLSDYGFGLLRRVTESLAAAPARRAS